jgi:flagellar biosynthesis protein
MKTPPIPYYRTRAVALTYNPDDVAPKVVAAGAGAVAERILQKGRELDLPVYQDAKLTESLTRMDVGEFIPPELYDVVAGVCQRSGSDCRQTKK